MRWRNRLKCDGEIGCFYSSANTLNGQLPDERVAGPADPAEAHGVRARPLLRGEAEVGRHLPAGAEPREVADLGREGGGEREPASLDRLERLDLGREGARRDGGPVLGEEGLPRLVGRLDLLALL